MTRTLALFGALFCALLGGCTTTAATAQGVVQQVGPVTPGDAVSWVSNGQVMDAGNTYPVTTGSYTWTGKQTFGPSTSGVAAINVLPGTAPATPANGDIWATTSGFYAQINGVTANLAITNLASSTVGGVSGILPETSGGTGQTTAAGLVANVIIPRFSAAEIPTGNANGSNTTFYLANTPVGGSLMLVYNGLVQAPSVDYTISGETIVFVTAPVSGAVIRAFYWY